MASAPRRGVRGLLRPATLTLLWVAVGAVPGVGQALDDLRTSPSPGFAILGLTPTAIERPTTPVALGFGLVSATEGGTVLPESYAVEVAPYWLTPRPLLTFSERYRPSFWQGLKQSFAVSVATDRSVADSTRLGIGARVQLLAGRPSLRTEAARARLQALLDTIAEVAGMVAGAAPDADSAALALRLDSLETRERSLRRDFQARQWTDREGVRWEVAGAVASSFPSGTFADGDLTTWGLWSTLSIRPTAERLDLLFLLRYQELEAPTRSGAEANAVEVAVQAQQVLDGGVRLLYRFGRTSVSAELLGRTAFDISEAPGDGVVVRYDSSYRLTGSAGYRLGDDAELEWTFGRGFSLAGTDAGELVSRIGLKWAVGQGLDFP